MITFPNAKINIGLNITEKRSDGLHNLESCFYPIGWSDIVEIIPSDKLGFSSSGIAIPDNKKDNLCLQAYHLLESKYHIPSVSIHLHKVIPIGAGLGGGSSDGAFTLKMLNDIFELSLSIEQLEQYAGQLGSDCPFFIQNQPKLVTGTGNVFSEIRIDHLSGKYLVVVKPNIHISTAKAYAGIKPSKTTVTLQEVLENQSTPDWKNVVTNDFEQSIFTNHSVIGEIKNMLYEKGALYASMTGSGAAVFGIFDQKIYLEYPDSTIWKGQL